MTIKNSNYREIEAENGLGENIVYKLNENNKIVISSSVRLTTILNDGKYDISDALNLPRPGVTRTVKAMEHLKKEWNEISPEIKTGSPVIDVILMVIKHISSHSR